MSVTVDLEAAAQALELESRIDQTPASAAVRGVFLRILEQDLARRGFKDWANWNEALGEQPRSYRLYPLRRVMTIYAHAAALVSSDPREGIRQIFQGISRPFSESWYGRAFQKALRPDPLTALSWLERCHDQICNYGRWRVEPRGPGRVILHMFDEYLWIDAAHRGGCEGMLKACGVVGEVVAEVDSPFQGRLDVRWDVRQR